MCLWHFLTMKRIPANNKTSPGIIISSHNGVQPVANGFVYHIVKRMIAIVAKR